MDTKQSLSELIAQAITSSFPQVENLPSAGEIAGFLEIPPEKEMGDYAFPCFKLSRTLRMGPPQIAAKLAGAIDAGDLCQAKQMGGYLNFSLNRENFARRTLESVLAADGRWGAGEEGKGKTICLDFSSINIAKRFHIGHLSTTMIGQSLRRIFDFLGYKTVAINYLGDWGTQFGKLICASNKNNVLTDFLRTGAYTARREFYKTSSPSMDILVSSNLERLLYHVTGSDAEVAALMGRLAREGSYTVRPETLAAIQASFSCGWASEEEVAAEIRTRWERDGYLCDTHTAVAFHVAEQHKRQGTPMVVLSTASPFKFPRSVLAALGHAAPENDFEAMQALEQATGRTAPASLAGLRQKPERFDAVIDPAQIAEVALGCQA